MKIFRRFPAGRLNRRTFALGYLIYFLINVIVFQFVENPAIIDMTKRLGNVEYALLVLLDILYICMMFVIILSLVDRRLQDMGKDLTEFEHRLFVLPILECLFSKGENKENKYGKPPEPKFDLKGLFGFS